MKQVRQQSMGEELANSITHIVGSHLGAAMLALLVWQGATSGVDVAWKVTSGAIFGASMILLYVVSSAYHAVTNGGGSDLTTVMKKWNMLSRDSDSAAFRDYRASFLRRMWNASEFMKTLKQHYTMSFNGRRDHHGTMWESRYRVRVKDPGEFGMMMAESGYVDANPVNAGTAVWPDGYEWCSFAAACSGDETSRAGYDFVYGDKNRSWLELKELHNISIRQMLKEREWKDSEDIELARVNQRPDRQGKIYAANLETPGYIPQVIEKGDNVLAVRLLQLLRWKPQSPAYLRTSLGIASREYFTKVYLRPLAESGLIVRTDPDHPNSPRQKYQLSEAGQKRIERVVPL